MRHMLPVLLVSLALAACGVKRPLMTPEQAEAYEARRQQELEKREKERLEEQRRQEVLQPIRPY